MNLSRCFIIGQATWFVVFFTVLTCKLSVGAKEIPAPPKIEAQPPVVLPSLPPMPPATPADPELAGVQVPIPKQMRVFNRSGSQCVWCTIQILANYNNALGAQDLTKTYKRSTGPKEVRGVLENRGVKFKQTSRKDEDMLEEYVTQRHLGAGVGVNHGSHMVLVCHFDRKARVVKIIDNSDRSLRVQTWTLEQFRQRWSEWVLVILPDNYPDTAGTIVPGNDTTEWWAWWNSKR